MSCPIIIAGMHRSGTSMVASMFQRMGVDMGARLLEAGPHNKRGYFEDRDFIDLHEDLLAGLGTSLYLDRPMRGEIGERFHDRARGLVEMRSCKPLWGWKDPRTTLFLEWWLSLLPDARFVFVYRDPAEVLDSLRRRCDADLHRRYPGAARLVMFGVPRFKIKKALRFWVEYNRRIVEFVDNHQDRCHVICASEGTLLEGFEAACEDLRRCGVPLEQGRDPAELIEAALLGHEPQASIRRAVARDRTTQGLLDELGRLAAGAPG